jgi:KDO2-lipid IV(A) lauroyltransferase
VPALDAAALAERVTIEGREHLDAARAASKTGGVVVLTAHFGSWELLAVAMAAAGFPVALVHRPRDNPALDAVLNRLRSSGGSVLLARGSAARAALGALREGQCLAMTYDQNCRREEGVFVPFFGRLACTRDGPPRVAMRTGAPVVPVFVYRQPDGIHHVARIFPAVALVPEGDDRAAAVLENARRMTRVVEEAVRGAPDHWIWMHRRWRTQPPGEPRPYPSRRG